MCFKCKHIRCICHKLKLGEAPKREYVNAQLLDNYNDFYVIKGLIEQKLGIRIGKTEVLKHILVIALNHYKNGEGVQSLRGV